MLSVGYWYRDVDVGLMAFSSISLSQQVDVELDLKRVYRRVSWTRRVIFISPVWILMRSDVSFVAPTLANFR
jgi:hypothetical protein